MAKDETKKALKAALAILGIGITAGTTIVIGMDKVMQKIFVDEKWPENDWTNNDWAEEELDG